MMKRFILVPVHIQPNFILAPIYSMVGTELICLIWAESENDVIGLILFDQECPQMDWKWDPKRMPTSKPEKVELSSFPVSCCPLVGSPKSTDSGEGLKKMTLRKILQYQQENPKGHLKI